MNENQIFIPLGHFPGERSWMRSWYISLIAIYALRSAIARSRRGVGSLILFIVQAAILMLGILFVPQLRVVDPSAEMRTLIAGLLALIGSGVLFFLWDILIAPAKMYRELQKKYEIANDAINSMKDADRQVSFLSKLYYEGREIYVDDDTSREEWTRRMEDWHQRCTAFLTENFSFSLLHEFNSIGGGFVRTKSASWASDEDGENETFWLLSKWTNRLDAMNNIVRTAHLAFVGKQIRSVDQEDTRKDG